MKEQMSQAQLDAYSDRYITKMTILFLIILNIYIHLSWVDSKDLNCFRLIIDYQ